MLITAIKYIFAVSIIIASLALSIKSVVGLIQKLREYKEEKKESK